MRTMCACPPFPRLFIPCHTACRGPRPAPLWPQDHLLMEASFPASYPREPFLLRMIRPRCVW